MNIKDNIWAIKTINKKYQQKVKSNQIIIEIK